MSKFMTEENLDALVDLIHAEFQSIPEKSKRLETVLLASVWNNGYQTIYVDVKGENEGLIGAARSATDEQMMAAIQAQLRVAQQGTGYLVVEARGVVPEIDIPVEIFVF